MHANGDTPPPNDNVLRKLYGQLKGMAKEARRHVAHRRNRVIVGKAPPKLPRQICKICGLPFDFAPQTRPGIPELSFCGECKAKLAEGYTALVGKASVKGDWLHAFVKSKGLNPGEVIENLSEETMQAVKNKMMEKKDGNQPPNTD